MLEDYQQINIDSSMVSLNFQLKSRSPGVKLKTGNSLPRFRIPVDGKKNVGDLNEYLSALSISFVQSAFVFTSPSRHEVVGGSGLS